MLGRTGGINSSTENMRTYKIGICVTELTACSQLSGI